MDRWKQTKLGRGLTIASWERLRGTLDPGRFDQSWETVIAAVEERFNARFVRPADAIQNVDRAVRWRFPEGGGFAIVALDCLLLETLASFETGRSSPETGKTFERLLTTCPGPRS